LTIAGRGREAAFHHLDRSATTIRHLRPLLVAAVAYPLALLLLLALLRGVGERWWPATIGLYLPRIFFALPLPVLAFLLWRRGLRRWLATQAVAALVLIFPLGGFVLPGPSRAGGGAPVLRVLSYNVMHAYAGPERIVAEIDRFSPDVVLLQKLGDNHEPMRRLLSARYPHVEISWGGTVASRFPITARLDPDQPLATDVMAQSRFLQKVISTPLGPIAFYSTHPSSPRDGLAAVARLRGVSLLKQETAWRTSQVRRLAARARAESIPVVIAGDTNIPELSPLLRAELGQYHDGFRQAGWGFGYTYPFNVFRWMRIDRILVSAPLRVVRFQIGNSTASDHLCVVADIQKGV
jgi:vancomycin resistance protein VanJ